MMYSDRHLLDIEQRHPEADAFWPSWPKASYQHLNTKPWHLAADPLGRAVIQWYLAHEKQRPPRTLL